MTRAVALIVAALTLTACDGSKRHTSGSDIVVVRNDTDLHADLVEPVVNQERQTPIVAPPTSPGLETQPAVSGTFTETPLPPELAHLKNLGAAPISTISKPEERIP